MAKRTCIVAGVLILAVLALPLAAQQSEADRATNSTKTATKPKNYEHWSNGPASDPGFFPIAVWVQAPKNAKRYKDAGINFYVGLWRGPTKEQLETLNAAAERRHGDQQTNSLAGAGAQ